MESISKILILAGVVLTVIAGYMISTGNNYSGYIFMSGLAVYMLVIFLNLLKNLLVKE